jgi:hypothetical protein
MKGVGSLKVIRALFLALTFSATYLHPYNALNMFPRTDGNSLFTNEAFIRGLNREAETRDPISVFRYVFSTIADEVNVYPTENYYYFECALRGIAIKGNIGLFADSRDDGIVCFTYEEDSAIEDPGHQSLEKEVDLTVKDGVYLRKISDFKYTITFEGRTVTFTLNDVGMTPPRKAILSPDETFVGPSFDESGLQFYLIYNQKCNSLFWILNEDVFVPEQFVNLTSALLIGRRTEFAFYDDKDNNRRILIGVKKENVIRNNWYDGPFDQLPDNYIKTGRIELQKYIEACYPFTNGKIDKYGIFLKHRDDRVGIAPYVQYSSEHQLVKLVGSLATSSKSKSEFYCRLTKAR